MRFAFVLTLAALVAAPAAAQQTIPTALDTVLAEVRVATSDLRNLVVAQELFYSRHGRYASSLDSLDYVPSRGSRVRFSKVLANGWGAMLARPRLRGGCVIWVNLSAADRPRTAEELDADEGEPRCDTPLEVSDGDARPSAIRVLTPDEKQRVARHRARSDLRNLVTAQEAYFADHGKYARDLATLQWTTAGSTVRFLVTEDLGWAAEVTRPEMSGTCVMWINVAEDKRPRTSPSGRSAREGEAVCDVQPETPGRSGVATPARPRRGLRRDSEQPPGGR